MSETCPTMTEQQQKLINHMVSSVGAVEMHSEPFPHIFIRDLFPQDFYARMIDMLPPTEVYEAFAIEKYSTGDGESVRKRCLVGNEQLDQLSPEQRELWFDVRAALGSPDFKNAIYQKLGPGLSYRFGCGPDAVADLPGYALPELYRETAAYRIKPHPDTRKKVVTMQISLARDESQVNLGTEFYSRSLRPSTWLREPKGFEITKVMQFLPNAAYAFVVLNKLALKSWHGRTTLESTSGVRNSILNIWYADKDDGHKDLFGPSSSNSAR
jgi:hypothetical protein